MANARAHPKLMTIGEGGSALAFAALAMFSIVVAAGAFTPEFAFHAYLFAAASIAAVFAIVNRYYERPDEEAPLIVDGKPNYNMGPVKFASIAAVVLGYRRIYRRPHHRAAARIPGAQFRSALDDFRTSAAAAHVGRDFCLWRQRSDRDVDVRRAANVSRADGRRYRALVRRARLQFLHCHRRHRLSARHYTIEGIRRARMVFGPVPRRRVGDLFPDLSRHHHAADRAAHLCRQLVLSRLHRHYCSPSSR